MEILQDAYRNSKWVRRGAWVGLLICAFTLLLFTGGFPPWAWHLLFAVIPTLPMLIATRGLGVLLPFIGLLSLSFALLLFWVGIVTAGLKMFQYWWQEQREHTQFAQDIEDAEELAEQMLTQEQRHRQPMQPLYETEQMRMVGAVGRPPVATATPTRSFAAQTAARPHLRVVPQPIPERDTMPAAYPLYAPSETEEQDEEFMAGDEIAEQGQEEIAFREEIEMHNTIPVPSPAQLQAKQRSLQQEQCEHENFRLVVGAGSDAGVVRSGTPNEDSLLTLQGMHLTSQGLLPLGLFVVADGMGGHAHGREASRTAVQTISDVVAPVLLRPNAEAELCAELLKDGAQRANLAVYQRNHQQTHMMGTTLTAALVFDTTAYVVNVGDSRTYLYRPGKGLKQITRDHSVVARLVERGVITPNDIYSHPKRNEIYRCLGEHAAVELDTFQVTLQPEDVLLLCSDGLWEMVHDNIIEKIVRSSSPHASQISSMLIQAALNNGGADNVSVVVVCVTGD